jgi:Mg-chelatase subunit ChlD
VIINAQTAEEIEVRVTSSAEPDDVMSYLLDDPEHGFVEVSRELCYEFKDQAGQTLLPSQVQAPESTQTSNITRIQLNITGIGQVQQITLPIDVVIAVDSSGSMKDNDHDNIRLTAAEAFVNMLSPKRGDQSGIVSWDDDIDFASPLTSNSSVTKMNIRNIDSSGDSDLDTGLNAAISILDANTRGDESSSSKAIIFLSDFEEGYTSSGGIVSPADSAKSKGYRIFSIGLDIENGTRQERTLKDMANASSGQYYFSPSEEYLQAAFENMSQTVVSNTEPANVNVTEVIHNHIVINESSFSIEPTSIQRNLKNNQTIIRWQNIGQYVGNKDNKLSSDEIFSVNFLASVSSNMGGDRNATLPVRSLGESMAEYRDPSGNVQTVNISQTYINLTSQICPELPNGHLRLVFDKLIVPASFNGTIGRYEDRGSNVFTPDEEIHLYIQYGGIKQKRIVNDDYFGDIHYLTNTTGNFTITDKEGNIVYSTSENFLTPFNVETSDSLYINGSGSYVFKYHPINGSREPGDYVINYTITDNLVILELKTRAVS